jgi:hypothetical protein
MEGAEIIKEDDPPGYCRNLPSAAGDMPVDFDETNGAQVVSR